MKNCANYFGYRMLNRSAHIILYVHAQIHTEREAESERECVYIGIEMVWVSRCVVSWAADYDLQRESESKSDTTVQERTNL